jgi:hypothetical protein
MKILLVLMVTIGLAMPASFSFAGGSSEELETVKLADQEEEQEVVEEEEQEEEEEAEEEDFDYQEDVEKAAEEYDYDTVPENMKLYKDKYEAYYDESFEVVWAATLEAVNELGCQIARESYSQNDEGLYKGIIKTDMCVFTSGTDSTYDVLQRYSKEMPFIRGGVWQNGRMQYKFVVKELADGSVHILQKSELSGFEENVMNLVYFWESNGILETRIMEKIDKKIKG